MGSLKDSYKLYRVNGGKVNRIDYLKITAAYCRFLIKKIIEGHTVTLPFRMGYLSIQGRKQNIQIDKETGKLKGLAPDWVKTKKLWDTNEEAKLNKKIIYHLNPHSNNYRYKFFWSKKNILTKNKIMYSFRASRENKRTVSKEIFSGKQYKTVNS